MTKSKGGRRPGSGRPPKGGREEDGPSYWLHKYKTTERPRPCGRCRQNAYYYHDDFHYLCAAHLLDLINLGEMLFKWDDYPEVWQRTERLLARPPLSAEELSIIVKNASIVDTKPETNVVKRGRPKKLDMWNE